MREGALDRVRDATSHMIVSAEIEMNDRTQLIALKPRAKLGKSLNEPGTYKLARVVTIDCSEHVKEYLAAERRTAPRVRWLTRGHGKMQTHGPRGSLRNPFASLRIGTKDQELPVADRAHRLKKKKG